MAVRNFYVEADLDGRQTKLGGGPKAKEEAGLVFRDWESEGTRKI